MADPLLGWGMTESEIRRRGFTVKNNCVLLEYSNGKDSALSILITGGSTSDVALFKDNWTFHLHKLLSDGGISHKLFVAAIGGFGSGQELLKLIRDGINTRPDIHISYSGANEYANPKYASEYETEIFRLALTEKPSRFLPNTIALLRKTFRGKFETPSLIPSEENVASDFWYNNVKLMDAIAKYHHYRFISILQPVKGVGKHIDGDEEKYEWHVSGYKEFYPKAQSAMQQDTVIEFHDLSRIFDTVSGKIFKDDCHLFEERQPVIAKEVFKIITNHSASKM